MDDALGRLDRLRDYSGTDLGRRCGGHRLVEVQHLMNASTAFLSTVVVLACTTFVACQGADAQALRGAAPAGRHTTWSEYAGGADASQYSALSQINRTNVNTLRVAWTYPTGDGANYLFNPLVVDEFMYVLARNNSIVALDAASGKEIWVHENGRGRITTRGINYWESTDRSERRLLY